MSTKRKSVTLSELRTNIYTMVDDVLKTGEPILISRNGRTLRIIPDSPPGGKLEKLVPQPGLLCRPEELVDVSWEGEWSDDESIS